MERIVWDNFSKQLSQFSYFLEADEGDGQNTSVQTIPPRFTYFLETDGENRIGYSDEGYSNN